MEKLGWNIKQEAKDSGVSNPRPRPYDPHACDNANVIFRHPQNFSTSCTFQDACSPEPYILRRLKVGKIKYFLYWQYPTIYDIHSKVKSKVTLINQIISWIESIHQVN